MPEERIRDYILERKLGRGGMSTVYLARHVHLGTKAALKFLHEHLSDDSSIKERFVNEARLLHDLQHPNIVQQKEFFEENGRLVLVMEYVEGRGLDGMIGHEVGPIPWEKTLGLFTQMLEGIGYAHSRGVVHRDIKPANILVSPDGRVKVTDLGIAKIAGQHGLTKTGTNMGTLFYESPEQVRGAREADHRSDIYSLGMTLYEMLAGRLPFDTEGETSEFSVMNTIANRCNELDPRDHYPHVPEWLVRVVRKATALESEHRFQSCGEFLEALETGVATDVRKKPASAGVPSPGISASPRQPSNHAGVTGQARKESSFSSRGLLILIAVLAVVGVVIIALNAGRPEPVSENSAHPSQVENQPVLPETAQDEPAQQQEEEFDPVNTIRPEVLSSLAYSGRSRLIRTAELEELSYRELKLLRNYYFAYYNRPFEVEWIGDYFRENMTSYRGTGSSDPPLTDIERENVSRIIEYERVNNIPIMNH